MLFCLALLLPIPAGAQGNEPADFKGSPCTKDCSGHRAGYAWAQKKGIERPEDCRGRSESFVKGCRIYAGGQESADDEAPEKPDQED